VSALDSALRTLETTGKARLRKRFQQAEGQQSNGLLRKIEYPCDKCDKSRGYVAYVAYVASVIDMKHTGRDDEILCLSAPAARVVVPIVYRKNPATPGCSGGVLKGAVGFAYSIRFLGPGTGMANGRGSRRPGRFPRKQNFLKRVYYYYGR
jgi:hypothetical protein